MFWGNKVVGTDACDGGGDGSAVDGNSFAILRRKQLFGRLATGKFLNFG